MAQRNKSDLRSWMGLKNQINVADLPAWMGGLAGVIAMLLALALALLVGATLVKLLYAVLSQDLNANPTSKDIRNLGLAAAAMIGVPFLIWRSIVAQKQVDVTEQGHITDRINKAVEGLGAEKTVKRDGQEITEPNLEVRIGALYALERISQDSARDHIQIMEILCAYIRQNAPQNDLTPSEAPFTRATPRLDIQTALTILCRREETLHQIEHKRRYRLDLRGCDLSGSDLTGGNFTGSILWDCRLEACIFDRADLTGTQFFRSLINFSSFHKTKLIGTRFDFAVASAGSTFNFLDMSEVKGVIFRSTDLSNIRHKLARNFSSNVTFGCGDTALSTRLGDEFRRTMEMKESLEFDDLSAEDKQRCQEQINKSGFQYWSPYGTNDFATDQYLSEFMTTFGLTDWPHRNGE